MSQASRFPGNTLWQVCMQTTDGTQRKCHTFTSDEYRQSGQDPAHLTNRRMWEASRSVIDGKEQMVMSVTRCDKDKGWVDVFVRQ
jgi:hypothetical protein